MLLGETTATGDACPRQTPACRRGARLIEHVCATESHHPQLPDSRNHPARNVPTPRSRTTTNRSEPHPQTLHPHHLATYRPPQLSLNEEVERARSNANLFFWSAGQFVSDSIDREMMQPLPVNSGAFGRDRNHPCRSGIIHEVTAIDIRRPLALRLLPPASFTGEKIPDARGVERPRSIANLFIWSAWQFVPDSIYREITQPSPVNSGLVTTT